MFRAPAQPKRRTSQLYSFPAPKGGWIANQNISRPDPAVQGAWQLTNFFPTATGAELRGGSLLYATLGDTTASSRSRPDPAGCTPAPSGLTETLGSAENRASTKG